MLALADKLSLDVVAEGIEHPEQADVLSKLGRRYGQVFLWSPSSHPVQHRNGCTPGPPPLRRPSLDTSMPVGAPIVPGDTSSEKMVGNAVVDTATVIKIPLIPENADRVGSELTLNGPLQSRHSQPRLDPVYPVAGHLIRTERSSPHHTTALQQQEPPEPREPRERQRS